MLAENSVILGAKQIRAGDRRTTSLLSHHLIPGDVGDEGRLRDHIRIPASFVHLRANCHTHA